MAPSQILTRAEMIDRLTSAARNDPRIVGMLDCGSSNWGHADEWSDIDLAVFIRDADLEAFSKQWVPWAGRLGTLLLGYISGVGHPWAVYDASPIPLRVDFTFLRESDVQVILDWPQSPTTVESAVWYDATGKLSACVQQLVGRSLGPKDAHAAFDQVCGDFWDYCLRTFAKTRRDQPWAARYDLTCILHGNLIALLRLEAGATERWRSTSAAVGIERVLSPRRLEQLSSCLPGPDNAHLRTAFVNTAHLGYDACSNIARANGWSWPRELAGRVVEIFEAD